MSKTIEISDETATLLDVRSSAAGMNPSDLIATWAREDAVRERSKKIAALQKLVDEGLASGPCDQSMDEILAEARAQVAATRPGRLGERSDLIPDHLPCILCSLLCFLFFWNAHGFMWPWL